MVAHTRVGKSMDEWVGRGFVKLRNRVIFFLFVSKHLIF